MNKNEEAEHVIVFDTTDSAVQFQTAEELATRAVDKTKKSKVRKKKMEIHEQKDKILWGGKSSPYENDSQSTQCHIGCVVTF